MGGDMGCLFLLVLVLLFYTPYERKVGCFCLSYDITELVLGW